MTPGISERQFAWTILKWFDQNRRELPWRETRDPYLIWLSEVILQQTRVAQGLSYYKRLTQAFPTVSHLANARVEQVLRLWQGLGYYTRARNLHRCARVVAGELEGRFPRTYEGLLLLPGIGAYTAAAISSIAFNEQVAALDGNVFRVLSRIFGIKEDIGSPAGRRVFQEKASTLVPSDRPGDFNQALMELGAIQCTPRNPDCPSCPFKTVCIGYASSSIHLLPVKVRRAKVRERFFHYVVFLLDGKMAMKPRNGSDIWTGLYDFYLIEAKRRLSVSQLVRSDKALGSLVEGDIESFGAIKHQLTHQRLHIAFFHARVSKKNLTNFDTVNRGLSFYSLKQAARLPKPVPVAEFLEKLEKTGLRN